MTAHPCSRGSSRHSSSRKEGRAAPRAEARPARERPPPEEEGHRVPERGRRAELALRIESDEAGSSTLKSGMDQQRSYLSLAAVESCACSTFMR
jgi:hypothetical protein